MRDAVAADAAAIASFHTRIWQQTYRDLAPPEAIARLDVGHRLRQWERVLRDPPTQAAILAETCGAIAGLVSFGATDTPVYDGRAELSHLYVAPDHRGRGLGRQLLAMAHGRLMAAGFPGMGLAVVRGNHAARAFYAALGGIEAAAFADPGPLWKSDNLLVVWGATPPGPSQ
ncbi:Ribosomal protein S18 acetylase RimI [Gemmobacter megaterium]|uniref:Ribosomal protein S18 acetylase RimI n=1 Tax=Gemmobacter megaterium TaxID=1086013 RepID=A0A1N7M762_9RHOB|nr:GNAT family N-acetyltransferase [Gemmobacter megaterium]SIS81863.1 Ribosomal protein S18 acetylase RimI [Gemmobacter megaterium]